MRLEAVTVCVGYADYLREVAPVNQAHFDHWVVVTSPDDSETIDVCRRHSIRCVRSEEHRRGGPFNKGRLIQRALDQLDASDWVLHVDADVVLPRMFRRMVDWAHLDPTAVYGCDRQMLVGYDRWLKLKAGGGWDNHAHSCGHWFHPELPVGSRWVSEHHGYVPIGFFQLWHGSASLDRGTHARPYPVHHSTAARGDVQFALQWDRRKRLLLPEVIALHLESGKSGMGANWSGRTTPRFGPPPSGKPPERSPSS